MEQRVINPGKVLRTIRKTTVILKHVLADVNDDQAHKIPAPGEWSVHSVVRHLLEYEIVLRERIDLILTEDMPTMPSIDNQHITDTPDAGPNMQTIVGDLQARRQDLLAFLENVTGEQWSRQGRHPQQGLATVLEVALNGAMHDVDHVDQIMETLDW
jgi:hypothetical protein